MQDPGSATQTQGHSSMSWDLPFQFLVRSMAWKYLKIGTCPASQKLLTYMGENLTFTRNIKIFACPSVWSTHKYERTSARYVRAMWTPLNDFSLNFTQMFHSVRRCAEAMSQLCRIKVKVTLEGHGIHPSICVQSVYLHFTVFHLGRHCLPKYLGFNFPVYKGL